MSKLLLSLSLLFQLGVGIAVVVAAAAAAAAVAVFQNSAVQWNMELASMASFVRPASQPVGRSVGGSVTRSFVT